MIVLDNGAFHKAKSIVIPHNIRLLFLPPYSTELNPAEKMWAKFKRTFSNKLHKTLEELSDFIDAETKTITHELVKSTCAFTYILKDLFWTK